MNNPPSSSVATRSLWGSYEGKSCSNITSCHSVNRRLGLVALPRRSKLIIAGCVALTGVGGMVLSDYLERVYPVEEAPKNTGESA